MSSVLEGRVQVGFTHGVEAYSVALAVAILVGGASLAASPSGDEGARVKILFDLGDGVYLWSDAAIEDPAAANATWQAVLAAAESHGLEVEWTWFEGLGVAILDVGDRNPPAGFVGLFAWNRTAGVWEPTDVGISSLQVRDGGAIALYAAAFDGVTYDLRSPVPTPDRPDPSLMFRGDLANSGTSRSTAPSTGRLLWDRDVGVAEIGSTPAVAYGRVFVTTLEGLHALDADTGGTLWTNPAVRGFSSPAVFNGTVTVGAANGSVYQVDAFTGEERWKATLLEETAFSGIVSSPKVAWDHVYIGTFNESGGPGEVVSLWATNGTIAWRTATASVHFSSPAIADGTVYVGLMGRYNTTTQVTYDPPYGVLALDARDGRILRSFATEGPVAASPAIAGGLLIVPSKDGRVYGIDRETFAEVWRAEVGAGVSSPAVHGDAVFLGGGAFGDANGRVIALDAGTGAVRWTFPTNGPVQASVAYADGKVYAATNTARGTVYALNATRGSLLWTHVPRPEQYILGSPVVADGTLYAPSDNGHVLAFRDGTGGAGPTGVLGDLVTLGVLAAVGIAVAAAAVTVLLYRRRPRGP